MPALFDTHVHLDVEEFAGDRDAVLARARAVGVEQFLVPAVDQLHWPDLAALAAREPGVLAAYGIHPMYLSAAVEQSLQDLPDWIARHPTHAIGECGLDLFVEGIDPELQRRVFRRQLEIAREFDLPVIIHARRAVEQVILMLRAIGGLRGIVHSFPGSYEQARQLHDLGFHVGIGGPVTYPRANRLRRLVAEAPLEWLLLETDAPDQPCAMHRGERNEPNTLVDVLAEVAALRREHPDAIAASCTRRAEQLFGLAA